MEAPCVHLPCCSSPGRGVLLALKAPTLGQGWGKQEKCLARVACRRKRLVVMNEMLPSGLGSKAATGRRHLLSGEALPSAAPACCSSHLLSLALSEPCPSPLGVWTQSEMLSWL